MQPEAGMLQLRIAASWLLVLYLAAVAILIPRELSFLRNIERRQKIAFIVLDVLVQLSILAVLLPCLILPELGRAAFLTIGAGFILLWVAALWAIAARKAYTYRMLVAAQKEAARALAGLRAEAAQQQRATDKQNPSQPKDSPDDLR